MRIITVTGQWSVDDVTTLDTGHLVTDCNLKLNFYLKHARPAGWMDTEPVASHWALEWSEAQNSINLVLQVQWARNEANF